jgi:hypothetical protein
MAGLKMQRAINGPQSAKRSLNPDAADGTVTIYDAKPLPEKP